jgi:hypothetical protein
VDTVSRDVAIHPNPIATAAAVNKASLPTIAAAVSNSAGYVYFLSLLIVDLNMLHLLLLFLSLFFVILRRSRMPSHLFLLLLLL